MFVARWQIDARFGHKQEVIELGKRWLREIGSKAGTDKMDIKILTGSIGARNIVGCDVIDPRERS